MFNKKHPADHHPFIFSYKSLNSLLYSSGFRTVYFNRYYDSDVMMIIAKKIKKNPNSYVEVDNFKDVKNFFMTWEKLSKSIFNKKND